MQSSTNPINYEVNANFLNPAPYSSELTQNLPLQQTNLVRVSIGLALLYAGIVAFLAGQLIWAPVGGVKKIHYWFMYCALLGLVAFCFYAQYYMQQNQSGGSHSAVLLGGRVISHLASFALLLTMTYLALGYSIFRTALTERETSLITPIFAAYLLCGLINANSCSGGDDDPTCVIFSTFTDILRSVIVLAMIIALNFSMTSLRNLLISSPWAPSVPLQHFRLAQYTEFRNILLAYILLPTFVIVLTLSLLSWEEFWIQALLVEMIDVIFLTYIVRIYAPSSDIMVTRAFDGSLSRNEGSE
jgi:hypothetical protein